MGLTQEELGERMGITQAAVQQFESGKRVAKIDTLKRIADALGVPVNTLIDDDTRLKNSFGDIIKKARIDLELSLMDFAEKCGMSYVDLDNIEKGFDTHGNPVLIGSETIKKLSAASGIPEITLEQIVVDERRKMKRSAEQFEKVFADNMSKPAETSKINMLDVMAVNVEFDSLNWLKEGLRNLGFFNFTNDKLLMIVGAIEGMALSLGMDKINSGESGDDK